MSSKNQAVARQHGQEVAATQQKSSQQAQDVEEHESHASASAQGGLNLNIFGALSGAFSGKRKTTKNTNADGSSIEVVDEEGQGHARGAGAANMNAYGAAQAQADERRSKQQGAEQKKLAGSSKQQKQVQQVDHLGIEGAK